jgi:hypothetical protein
MVPWRNGNARKHLKMICYEQWWRFSAETLGRQHRILNRLAAESFKTPRHRIRGGGSLSYRIDVWTDL